MPPRSRRDANQQTPSLLIQRRNAVRDLLVHPRPAAPTIHPAPKTYDAGETQSALLSSPAARPSFMDAGIQPTDLAAPSVTTGQQRRLPPPCPKQTHEMPLNVTNIPRGPTPLSTANQRTHRQPPPQRLCLAIASPSGCPTSPTRHRSPIPWQPTTATSVTARPHLTVRPARVSSTTHAGLPVPPKLNQQAASSHPFPPGPPPANPNAPASMAARTPCPDQPSSFAFLRTPHTKRIATPLVPFTSSPRKTAVRGSPSQ